jgi:hypothetical protein
MSLSCLDSNKEGDGDTCGSQGKKILKGITERDQKKYK